MQNRFVSLLIAALLPLLLFSWFVPQPTGQIDFWLMWIFAMIAVGLPLLYAEIGLAHRSQRIPVQGIQALTRQADASQIWRSFAWLTVLLALIISALSIDAVSSHLLDAAALMGIEIDIPQFAIASGMVVVAGILSLLGGSTVVIAMLLLLIAFVIGALDGMADFALIMTDTSLAEWSRAVVLALVSVGVGTGLYWFHSPLVESSPDSVDREQAKKMKEVATKTVFPIWLTQLAIGSVAIVLNPKFNMGAVPAIATLIYTLGIIATAAFLIHYASSQIATRLQRFGVWIATVISIVLTVLMVTIANPAILVVVLKGISLFVALVLAIFAGWQMKISHMRKSLNFQSEGVYNIWRIAIRIVVPLLILVAIIGWFF